eukprot:TRINITY_DN4526_c0_g1_i5.p1 TRINITY_DN4526_c0_g1~~TRINITY_DN4526_c0_g1_i5.p1  ORF type:complete len:338 (+),score=72.96 TRINITY_DN4526_c0_g1_i5:1161-2174(+)
MHVEPAVAFAALGYHILLEKPIAVSERDCVRIYNAVRDNHCIFATGHVLRYTPYSLKMKEILENGAIGEIVSVQHLEPVGFYHHAHSYVRGNWRNEEESTFMLMAKSCHDIDWILGMVGKKCKKISSFGSLKFFNREHKPEYASSRCYDCPVEETCAFSAKKIYLDNYENMKDTSFCKALTENPTYENVEEAVINGPYGRCVFDCDNNVVDNQVVNIEFEGGATATFTMVAFTEKICVRSTRIFGTKGEITGDSTDISVFDFLTGTTTKYHTEVDDIETQMKGHGKGDYFLMRDFVNAVGTGDVSHLKCTPEDTLNSHLTVFRAEESRRTGSVVNID